MILMKMQLREIYLEIAVNAYRDLIMEGIRSCLKMLFFQTIYKNIIFVRIHNPIFPDTGIGIKI